MNRTTRNIVRLFAILLLCLAALPARAQEVEDAAVWQDPYAGYDELTFMDMDLEPNLLTPVVPDQESGAVIRYIRSVAEQIKSNLTVDLYRDGEVLIVTFPTDDLFLPNDTLFNQYADRYLDRLLPLMKDPYMYKVVTLMHTDDTGSETYREEKSTARLNTVYDWFLRRIDDGFISDELVLIPFSMSSHEPVAENDTRAHRRQNRRVEFYFIPGPKMIELAHKHQLRL